MNRVYVGILMWVGTWSAQLALVSEAEAGPSGGDPPASQPTGPTTQPAVVPEPVYRDPAAELDARRSIGKGYYENAETPPTFDPAVKEFRRCIELAPDSAGDHFNLGLTLMRAERYEEALKALNEARRLDPNLPAATYVAGIVYKRLGQAEPAIDCLNQVVGKDPACAPALFNLGVCYKQLRDNDKALTAFKRAVELVPEHPSYHYQLMILYRSRGEVDNVARHKEIFDQVKDTLDESEKSAEALERSQYSYIIEVLKRTPALTPRPDANVRFLDMTDPAGLGPSATAAPLPPPPTRIKRADYNEAEVRNRYVPTVGGAVTLGDYDGDGDRDIYLVNCSADSQASANRLYRNDGGGHFTDVTAAAGVGDAGMGLDAIFGDYDNDGHDDLYVVNCGPNVLYHNQGNGTFEDVSVSARVNEPHFGRKAAWADYDHDYDLDLLVGNDLELTEPPQREEFTLPDDFVGAANALLRNNGNGTFTDQTDEAGLLVDLAQTHDLLFADFDADTDIDLFLVNANAPSRLFLNARLGRFKEGGSFSPPVEKGGRAAAEGDFNHDGQSDLLVAVGATLYLYLNDGQARFTGAPIPLLDGPTTGGVGRIQVFDYNNDGWSDVLLVAADDRSLGLLVATGPGTFKDGSAALTSGAPWGSVADAAIADLDGDGDEDIVLASRDRGLRLLRNEGGESAQGMSVRLLGKKKANRNGYGSTVEVVAGGHYQKQTVGDGWVHFGLGDREGIDLVRVIWPNGQAQNLIRPSRDALLTIEQHEKMQVSCGFLYAYNGARFELVNEILGVGALGAPIAPGVYYPPDSTELTKIEGRQLIAANGAYELRLTEELHEIMFADQIALRVVDHPGELQVIPNEMFTGPPFPEDKFFAVTNTRPPVSAMDERGTEVLSLVLEHDHRFPTFPLVAQYDGLAEPHSLTLDLGGLATARQVLLFLDSWIYWTPASAVMAIAQDPRYELTPLKLEVRDAEGRWQTVIESVGLPTSKGMVVPVDLTGKFPCDDYHVRLSTTMCVYFDRVFVATDDRAARCRVTELPVSQADLHDRGFSRMTRDELGYERFDYAQVCPTGPWYPLPGRYTRYGEVTELLARPDDCYVIFGPGDEVTLRFNADGLPELPAGWVRDFIFYADGWVKDGDLNTKYSESVGPLPFHGMSGYPYPESEHDPDSPERRRYQETYNTREARPTIGDLRPGATGSAVKADSFRSDRIVDR